MSLSWSYVRQCWVKPSELPSITDRNVGAKLKECTPQFLNDFFTWCCGYIIDYLLDFHKKDTLRGREHWRAISDRLKDCADKLPHAYWDDTVKSCAHARHFHGQFDSFIAEANTILLGRSECSTDDLLHHAHPMVDGTKDRHGAYKAGLKPWEQWLFNGSPGFGVKEQYPKVGTDLGAHGVPPEDIISHRFVPMGALSIAQRNLESIKAAYERVSEDVDDPAALMRNFDNNVSSPRVARSPFDASVEVNGL